MLTRPRRFDNFAIRNGVHTSRDVYQWQVRRSNQLVRPSNHSSELRAAASWIGPTTATTITPQDTLARIRTVFAFRNELDALAHLSQRPDIASALLDSLPTIEEVFGPNTSILIEVVRNPENPEEEAILFAFIQTSKDPSEARPLMERFRDSWWNAASANFRNDLNFGLLYR